MQRRDFIKGTIGAGVGIWGLTSGTAAAAALWAAGEERQATISPIDVRCESLGSPTTDSLKPRLSWKLQAESDVRGQVQSAYRVLVAMEEDLLFPGSPNLWNSGKVFSDRQLTSSTTARLSRQASAAIGGLKSGMGTGFQGLKSR